MDRCGRGKPACRRCGSSRRGHLGPWFGPLVRVVAEALTYSSIHSRIQSTQRPCQEHFQNLLLQTNLCAIPAPSVAWSRNRAIRATAEERAPKHAHSKEPVRRILRRKVASLEARGEAAGEDA